MPTCPITLDVVVARDGTIWFTDPTYGIDSDYEGHRSASEVGESCLYRVDPATGIVDRVVADFIQPNGLAFSADGTSLYVADTGQTHMADGPRHIRRFALSGKDISGGEVISTCTVGLYDGFRVDEQGHIWTSTGEGVHCLTADGKLIGRILVPEVVSNVCFCGAKRNRLFICGTTSLYATYLGVSGLPY